MESTSKATSHKSLISKNSSDPKSSQSPATITLLPFLTWRVSIREDGQGEVYTKVRWVRRTHLSPPLQRLRHQNLVRKRYKGRVQLLISRDLDVQIGSIIVERIVLGLKRRDYEVRWRMRKEHTFFSVLNIIVREWRSKAVSPLLSLPATLRNKFMVEG